MGFRQPIGNQLAEPCMTKITPQWSGDSSSFLHHCGACANCQHHPCPVSAPSPHQSLREVHRRQTRPVTFLRATARPADPASDAATNRDGIGISDIRHIVAPDETSETLLPSIMLSHCIEWRFDDFPIVEVVPSKSWFWYKVLKFIVVLC